MSVDPKETAAFANILGKLDGVQKGETVVDVAAGNQKRLADNDMNAILNAFASTSGTSSALSLTPEALTESADQVSAEFKPKTISPVLGEPEKDHPMDGMLVGEKEEQVTETIRKLPSGEYRLYSKDGKKNLGTFSSRSAAEKHEREVQYFKHAGESVESPTNEDSLTDIKKHLTDYLHDVKNGNIDNRELQDKKPQEDVLGPAIKTVNLDSGNTLKIHGNEDDGFRVKVNNKLHSKTFDSLDDVLMACESFIKRTNRK